MAPSKCKYSGKIAPYLDLRAGARLENVVMAVRGGITSLRSTGTRRGGTVSLDHALHVCPSSTDSLPNRGRCASSAASTTVRSNEVCGLRAIVVLEDIEKILKRPTIRRSKRIAANSSANSLAIRTATPMKSIPEKNAGCSTAYETPHQASPSTNPKSIPPARVSRNANTTGIRIGIVQLNM
ncbi:hypothetical protein K0M31_002259 [Melipona bicolor]|uniref:Uncharacterized protein n=1 Tax=Melipona bicolor TaxID=60889 RepID=A0AA40KYH6_9HYME|nr:hypothetical protein K0M31_002259 [Melipona bicolor]